MKIIVDLLLANGRSVKIVEKIEEIDDVPGYLLYPVGFEFSQNSSVLRLYFWNVGFSVFTPLHGSSFHRKEISLDEHGVGKPSWLSIFGRGRSSILSLRVMMDVEREDQKHLHALVSSRVSFHEHA